MSHQVRAIFHSYTNSILTIAKQQSRRTDHLAGNYTDTQHTIFARFIKGWCCEADLWWCLFHTNICSTFASSSFVLSLYFYVGAAASMHKSRAIICKNCYAFLFIPGTAVVVVSAALSVKLSQSLDLLYNITKAFENSISFDFASIVVVSVPTVEMIAPFPFFFSYSRRYFFSFLR